MDEDDILAQSLRLKLMAKPISAGRLCTFSHAKLEQVPDRMSRRMCSEMQLSVCCNRNKSARKRSGTFEKDAHTVQKYRDISGEGVEHSELEAT